MNQSMSLALVTLCLFSCTYGKTVIEKPQDVPTELTRKEAIKIAKSTLEINQINPNKYTRVDVFYRHDSKMWSIWFTSSQSNKSRAEKIGVSINDITKKAGLLRPR